MIQIQEEKESRQIPWFTIAKIFVIVIFFIIQWVTVVPFMTSVMNNTQRRAEYNQNPDLYKVNVTIMDLDFIETGTWPFLQEKTKITTQEGRVFIVDDWQLYLVIGFDYEFVFKYSYRGELDLTELYEFNLKRDGSEE